ncbi:hypothetical protein F383_13252 [Gossypium arboreum]|uniref:Uncharacterized protein n=1 Tax=Gossypium arboreum TaxID=29729 RepID=A0A0B0NA57_GOSAR|nr:hypothetical protein F383_13252 [Gossypium arboreum]
MKELIAQLNRAYRFQLNRAYRFLINRAYCLSAQKELTDQDSKEHRFVSSLVLDKSELHVTLSNF